MNNRLHSLTEADTSGIFRKQSEYEPDGRQLGNAVDWVSGLDIFALNRQLLDDGSTLRRVYRQSRLGLAGVFQLGDLLVRHSELTQPLTRIRGERLLRLADGL